jgi:hypothetical protein
MRKLLILMLCFSLVQVSYGSECSDAKENYKGSIKKYREALVNKVSEDELKYCEKTKNIDKESVDEICDYDPNWPIGATIAVFMGCLVGIFTILNYFYTWHCCGWGAAQVGNTP